MIGHRSHNDSETYQIVRRSVSTKNDNSFITHRNSYNIISHLHARVSSLIWSLYARDGGRRGLDGVEERVGGWKPDGKDWIHRDP